MPKLVALIGTHGVGKTTIFEYLKEEISGHVAFISDIARMCPFSVGETTTPRAQLWILREQIRREDLTEKAICDKSVIDHYAYFVYWYGHRSKVETWLAPYALRYDLVIKMPANPAFLVDDGLRPTDVTFQQDVDRIIDGLLGTWGVKFKRLPNNLHYDLSSMTLSIVNEWLDK